MTIYKKIELVGAVFMTIGFACQFFLLTPMAEERQLSFNIEIMENQAKIYTTIYERAVAENAGQEVDTDRLAQNRTTYYDEILISLGRLDRQAGCLNYAFGLLFAIGSFLTIVARYRSS